MFSPILNLLFFYVRKKTVFDKISIFIGNLLSILILFRSDQTKFYGKNCFVNSEFVKKTYDELVLEFSWVQSIMTDLILLVQ
jgi:hypothetical protein